MNLHCRLSKRRLRNRQLTIFALTVLSGCYLIMSLKPLDYHKKTIISSDTPILLIVLVAIGIPYEGVAAESVSAYCKRHNYRLYIQKDWLGSVPKLQHRQATHTQKLLACTHVRAEKYLLVLDRDIVIGPWSPPIHKVAEYSGIRDRIGIVDEDGPSREIHDAVYEYRLRYRKKAAKMPEYYGIFGETFNPPHGMLNTGVILLQTQKHCEWMESIYYSKNARQYFSMPRVHYDQPVFGAALLRTGRYMRMDHSWNRGWVYYKDAHHVGGRKYSLGELWRKSYFMHFYWDKSQLGNLQAWVLANNITFDPQPYAKDLEA